MRLTLSRDNWSSRYFTTSTLALIVPAIKVLEHYNVILKFISLDVAENTVKLISRKLIGAVSPDGIDVGGLQQ